MNTYRFRPKNPAVLALARRTAGEHGVTLKEIVGTSRVQHVVHARHRFWHLLHTAGYSYASIGTQVGRRDPTSIMHGVKMHGARVMGARVMARDISNKFSPANRR